MRSRDLTRVASVACFDPQGRMLFLRRADDRSFSLPGGCLNPGEHPLRGAIRELYEEAALKPTSIRAVGFDSVQTRHGDVLVYAFEARVRGQPSAHLDPDREAESFEWASTPLPDHILSNLHSPKNVVLELLGLQNAPKDEAWAEYEVPVTSDDLYVDSERGRP